MHLFTAVGQKQMQRCFISQLSDCAVGCNVCLFIIQHCLHIYLHHLYLTMTEFNLSKCVDLCKCFTATARERKNYISVFQNDLYI